MNPGTLFHNHLFAFTGYIDAEEIVKLTEKLGEKMTIDVSIPL